MNDETSASLAVDSLPERDDDTGCYLDDRIVQIIDSLPDRTIRPARLAAELGISVNDACAELCALLAAVGGGVDGASFRFEKLVEDQQDVVMVFQFPPDFAKRARRQRRADDLWTTCRAALGVGIRALKIITAFGLILSLLILCVAAVAGLLAVLVAISRENRSGGHRTLLMRQIRSLFFTIRQLLWFYAVFGSDSEGQHPFLREIAYDLSLILSCCCGNPASLFYWLRASQLSRRRHRIQRGWRPDVAVQQSEVEGVSLIRRGSWGDSREVERASASDEACRGLLSVAVEFLFGPTSSSVDKSALWKLRAAVIVSHSDKSNSSGVPLEILAPYSDCPPASLESSPASTVEQGLLVVAHFNGVPCNRASEDMTKAEFLFPELLAESEIAAQYEHESIDDDDEYFLYAKQTNSSTIGNSNSGELPDFFKELPSPFTKLTFPQLSQCVSLGVLNLVGVLWLGQSISKGGLLELNERSAFAQFLLRFLLPLLRGYGILFLAVPTVRLLALLAINARRSERNRRRQRIANELKGR